MRWWERQIGGKPRGRIIALLRRRERTVDELAAELDVTPNAVRLHLQLLEREGLIRETGTRGHEGAGKPASLYGIAPSAEPSLSGAYAPVLVALIQSMKQRLTKKQVDALLVDAGRRIAPADRGKASIESQVKSTASMLRSLGAEVDVERTDAGFRLKGHACPLSAAVRAEPHSCLAIRELVGTMIDAQVEEHCDREGTPRCRFDVIVGS